MSSKNHDRRDCEARNPACRRLEGQVSELLRGELPRAEREAMEAHRAACPQCRRAWAAYARIVREVSALPLAARTERVWLRIEKHLEQEVRELEAELADSLAAVREAPLEADSGRVWRRLETRLRGAAPRSRARSWLPSLVDALALTFAAGVLLSILLTGNDVALDLAARIVPESWSHSLLKIHGTVLGSLFLPMLFVAFGGAVALISTPILLQAAQSPAQRRIRPGTVVLTTGAGSLDRTGGMA